MGLLGELLRSAFHPRDIPAMIKVKYGGLGIRQTYKEPLDELAGRLSDVDFCYAVLNKVSRSFAVVIQQLPEQLQDAVCIFYLVLRALDSVEDDMEYALEPKVKLLRAFHEKLADPRWSIRDVGDTPDYRILLDNFQHVTTVFQKLDRSFQATILDVTKKMGAGMADFAERVTVDTLKEYDLYCHYVAGLVGYGLSDLFADSGLEDPGLRHEKELSNSCGLLLQTVNITRDYKEDFDGDRIFWPKEIWGKYAERLGDLQLQPNSRMSRAALNDMVTNALRHAPAVLDYLSRLQDPQIFKFCAIPQVMAIATLAEIYNNPAVFQRVVKIRKGLSCRLMLETTNMAMVRDTFQRFARQIGRRVPKDDPNAALTLERVDRILEATRTPIPASGLLRLLSLISLVCVFATCFYAAGRYKERHGGGQRAAMNVASAAGALQFADFAAGLAGFLSVGYLFGFFGVQYV